MGYGAGSTGVYTLGGTGALVANQSEYVGLYGTGTFTQTAGSNTIATATGFFDVGTYAGAMGTYNLGGTGTLVANTNEYVGDIGTGVFNQTGGTNNSNANLFIGYNAAGAGGTYTLSAGSLLESGGSEYVGYSSTGAFVQMGGTNTIRAGSSGGGGGGSLYLGRFGSGTGNSYTLNAGTLQASVDEEIGVNATGVFTQTGGANSSGAIDLGGNAGSMGTYTLGGGTATIGGTFIVGSAPGGSGVLAVNNTGVLTVGGTLVAFNTPGSVINLSGGTINAAALNFNGVPSLLNWTGGTLNLTSSVTWDSSAASSSTSAAFGATLTLAANQTLMISGSEALGGAGSFSLELGVGSSHVVSGSITLNPNGTLTQDNGSSLSFASFAQVGGTFNGTLQNQTTFTYTSGLFNGQLINAGTATFNAPFTAANGLINYTSLAMGSGITLTLNGAGLDNEGTFTLAGGTINGGGPLVNNALLSGTGTVGGTAGFTNNAQISISGGNVTLSNTGANANVGNIDIPAGLQLRLTGGNLASTGTINLSGGIVTGAATLNNNAAGTISGHGTISTPFSNAGFLVPESGTINVGQAFTNTGLIQLTGFNSGLAGGALNNMGSIRGVGNLGNAVINNGTIEAFGGGILAVSGAVQNPIGGLLTAGAGNQLVVIPGLAANAGIISLTGGTFDNGGNPLNNTGQISGWGIFRTGGTGLDNNGSITFSGGLTTVNGPVTNENGKTIVVAYNPAIFTGLVTNAGSGTFNVISTTVTFAGGSSGNVPAFANAGGAAFAKAGSGALEVDGPPSLGSGSSLAVGDTGTLRFKATSGAAAVGTGVAATVASGATLELAGSVSALSSASNRVNITNNSTSAGILVSGIHQQVGGIDGNGTTQVNAGSDLTANHIIQNALIISGVAGNPGQVTIDASDASGNPLGQSGGFALAESLTPSGPFEESVNSSASLSSIAADSTDLAVSAAGNSVGIGNTSQVPEPSTLLLALLAVLVVISIQFVRHRFRFQAV